MKVLDNANNVEEDEDGLLLGEFLLFNHVVLQVDEIGSFGAVVVWDEAVQHQAQPLTHPSERFNMPAGC